MDDKVAFSEPQQYILTTLQRLNFFLSGIGAGKSFLIGVISAYFTEHFPDSVGLIAANSHNQLNTATLVQVREAWKKILGWEEGIDYVVGIIPPPHFKRRREFKSYASVISFPNGAIIFVASLERYKLLDGKNLSYALIDEIKDADPKAIKEVILPRLRQGGIYVDDVTGELTADEWNNTSTTPTQREPFAPLYLFSSPSKNTWLNEMFGLNDFEDEINALTYSKSDFFKRFVDNQVETMSEREAKMLIFANPFFSTGGEYMALFTRKYNVRPCPRRDGATMHVSFDFNVRPYVCMLVAQISMIGNKMTIEIIDEILGRPPRNRTADLCTTFLARYGETAKANGLYYYGDASGKNSDTRSDKNDYDIIDKKLRAVINNKSRRVPSKNPSIISRKEFCNNIFEGIYKDEIEIFVDPKCKELIKDFENLKEDADGKKDKKKRVDPDSDDKTPIELYGHLTDNFEYMIVELQRRLFLRHFK